jgi:3-oxoadipate enol-lactonase
MKTVTAGGLAALVDVTMARWFTAGFRAAAPEVVDRTRATFLATPPAGYLGCCAALRDADLRPAASRVRARSLVIAGTHDVATPAADGQWLAAAISGAALHRFEAAHLANLECAAAFTATVVEFLSAP